MSETPSYVVVDEQPLKIIEKEHLETFVMQDPSHATSNRKTKPIGKSDVSQNMLIRNIVRDELKSYVRAAPTLDSKLSAVVRFVIRMGVVSFYFYQLKEGNKPTLSSLIWPLFVGPMFV